MNFEAIEKNLKAPFAEPVISYPVGDYRLVQVRPDDQFSHQFLHAVAKRALDFLTTYESETQPSWLMDLLLKSFYQAPRAVFVLAALDHGNNVCGHAIAYVEQHSKFGYVAHVLQIEKDDGLPYDITFTGQRMCEEWARDLGLKKMMSCALSLAHARMNQKHGFKIYRVITEKDL